MEGFLHEAQEKVADMDALESNVKYFRTLENELRKEVKELKEKLSASASAHKMLTLKDTDKVVELATATLENATPCCVVAGRDSKRMLKAAVTLSTLKREVDAAMGGTPTRDMWLAMSSLMSADKVVTDAMPEVFKSLASAARVELGVPEGHFEGGAQNVSAKDISDHIACGNCFSLHTMRDFFGSGPWDKMSCCGAKLTQLYRQLVPVCAQSTALSLN
jgi:hypothetical protein